VSCKESLNRRIVALSRSVEDSTVVSSGVAGRMESAESTVLSAGMVDFRHSSPIRCSGDVIGCRRSKSCDGWH
jgi:hypothetical protein